MSPIIENSFKCILCLCLVILSMIDKTVFAEESDKQTLMVQFAPQQVVQLIAPISDPEKAELRTDYYKTAIPLAQSYGFKNHGLLYVKETLAGDFKPPVIVIGGWPSQQAQTGFKSHGNWQEIKTKRQAAWEELMIYNHLNTERLELSFDKNKSYTVEFAWTKIANPNSYFEYLDAMEPLLEKMGARFVSKFKGPNLDAFEPNAHAPHQITFIEWQSDDDLAQLQALPEYKRIESLLLNGTEKFEWHRVSPRI